MNLEPVTLEHGQQFGKLRVLRKVTFRNRGPKYQCGCACGFSEFYAKASQLMSGKVKSCSKCR